MLLFWYIPGEEVTLIKPQFRRLSCWGCLLVSSLHWATIAFHPQLPERQLSPLSGLTNRRLGELDDVNEPGFPPLVHLSSQAHGSWTAWNFSPRGGKNLQDMEYLFCRTGDERQSLSLPRKEADCKLAELPGLNQWTNTFKDAERMNLRNDPANSTWGPSHCLSQQRG